MSTRKPGRDGRLRIDDNSLEFAGIHKGDLLVVDLTKQPEQDELCVAFIATGKLVVRYFHREENGDIRLTKGPDAKLIQVFAPSAVIILGCIADIIRAL